MNRKTKKVKTMEADIEEVFLDLKKDYQTSDLQS